jgi:hypothetical protein
MSMSSRCLAGRRRRLEHPEPGAERRISLGDGLVEALPGQQRLVHAAAGHHQVGAAELRVQRLRRHGADAVGIGEDLRPAGRGVDADVLRAASAQGSQARPRVRTGADEQDPGGTPVADAAVDHREGQLYQRTALGLQAGAVLDPLRDHHRVLEEPFELGARPARGTRRVDGAPHLSRDLALADGGRFETAGDGEQMLDRGVAAVHRARVREFGRSELGSPRQSVEGLLGSEAGRIEVGLEAVAGGEHDGAASGPGIAESGGHRVGAALDAFEQIEIGIPMIDGEAEQHEDSREVS